jgi:cryptochrome
MRQLRTEGWIHHLGRHAVACFLTRGGCYISWERGAEVFEEWLLDHETACNAGNWQWLSCTAFFSQFFRCYSPIAFPQKWDKQGKFVRKYVPELEKLGDKWIYEPWKAPMVELKKAGIKLGAEGKGGYPRPMFDFAERRAICLEGMKNAYHVGLYGNNPKVEDGSWRHLFSGAEGSMDEKGLKEAISGKEKKVGTGAKTRSANLAPFKEGEEAAETGGDNKGGDQGGSKRKRGQITLDGHVKRTRR